MAKKRNKGPRGGRGRRKGAAHGAPGEVLTEGWGVDYDDHFAFIAGYTAGGVPFGTTWEEHYALENAEADLRSLEASASIEDLTATAEPPARPPVRGPIEDRRAREPRGAFRFWRKRRVVVTGAAGFIGAALSEALLRRGARVVGLDRAWSATEPVRAERIARLIGRRRFTPISVDLKSVKRLRKILARHWGSVVFHLAAQPGVRHPDVSETYRDNLVGTKNLLRALRRDPLRQVIFASSSSVYGGASPLPLREDGIIGTPASHYARSKLLGEVALRRFHAETGLPVTVTRLFNVYGPRGRPDTVPLLFARRLLAGEPITLAAAGTVERDFTFIDDVVDALVLLAEAADDARGLATVNVGTGVRTSISDFLAHLARHLGVPASSVHAGLAHPLDAPVTQADTARLLERVGWRPDTALDRGLAELVAWLRQPEPNYDEPR